MRWHGEDSQRRFAFDLSSYPAAMKKRFWRSYVDPAGQSHAEAAEVEMTLSDFAPPAPPILVSTPVSAAGFAYLRAPSGWFGGWHPAPRRQLLVVLRGALEGEWSDGSRIRMEPGDVILLEDTREPGHSTRVVSDEDVEALVVALPE